MNRTEIAGEIDTFLQEEFPNPGVTLERTTDLLNEYFVDSLGLVNTALFLESRFGIELSRADINESTFHSIDTLVEFVENRLEAATS